MRWLPKLLEKQGVLRALTEQEGLARIRRFERQRLA